MGRGSEKGVGETVSRNKVVSILLDTRHKIILRNFIVFVSIWEYDVSVNNRDRKNS